MQSFLREALRPWWFRDAVTLLTVALIIAWVLVWLQFSVTITV